MCQEPAAEPPFDESGSVIPDRPARNRSPQDALFPWPLLLSGILLPIFCFILGFPSQPNWQTGDLVSYVQLLMAHKATAPLYPLLLYSMVSLALLFLRPQRFEKNFFVRCGIFGGVLLAAEYWVLFQLAYSEFSLPVAAICSALTVAAAWILLKSLSFSRHYLQDARGQIELWAIVLISLIVLTMCLVPYPLLVVLWSATPWAVATYALVATRLIRRRSTPHFHFDLTQMLAAVGLLAAHCAAWRLSYLVMLDEYGKLPTTPPQPCFVCTAAAAGHPRVVRSQAGTSPDGKPMRVNDQLRYLKALELLLASASPTAHRKFRWWYNRIGPRAASMLRTPLLADVGYFALKPGEWLARLSLLIVIPRKLELVRQLYSFPRERG